jgi:RTX calcium-binding nonapeptide repeat (4 copies)
MGLLSAVLCALAFPALTSAATAALDDRGLYVAHCPEGEQAPGRVEEAPNRVEEPPGQLEEPASIATNGRRAVVAEANHEGWPTDECLKMDKGPAGRSHMIVGMKRVHNWLLGGYGNDTIFAGDDGDVIWGDYHPEGQSESQRDYIHGGPGEDWIYSSHGYNEIWTGAGNDHLALVYGHGVVFCDGAGLKTFVMRYLPQNRRWRLVGCSHKTLVRYRA